MKMIWDMFDYLCNNCHLSATNSQRE